MRREVGGDVPRLPPRFSGSLLSAPGSAGNFRVKGCVGRTVEASHLAPGAVGARPTISFMHPDAELLSSYFDGELSGAERAAAERLLREDAAACEFVAELRAVRDDLRLVPQYRLPEEFAKQVLRSAERLMLLGPDDAPASATTDFTSEFSEPAPRAAGRQLWSPPAWFITGAAAAVLLMVAFGPWRGAKDNEVADRASSENSTAVNPLASTQGTDERPRPAPSNSNVADEAPPEEAGATTPSGNPTTVDPPADPPKVAATDAPPATENTANAGPDETVNAGEATAPFGLVITCQVEARAYASRDFDSILRTHGIAVPKVRLAEGESPANDIVYVEATPQQLDNVFTAMVNEPATYHSPIMQLTLGTFRDPALWSELLDQDQGAAANDAEATSEPPATVDVVSPRVDAPVGSRGIHFDPKAMPAKPLLFEEATPEQLMEFGAQLASQFPDTDEPADDKPPVVDDGLVRAVFILRPLSAADASAPSP